MNRWLFALLGAPALVRAVARARATSGLPIDAQVERLRAVPRFRARALADAERWSGLVARLAPVLPVPGGRCLRRALVLLDLHARCGLEPELELALRLPAPGGHVPDGHAWLTTDTGPRRAAEAGAQSWRPVVRL